MITLDVYLMGRDKLYPITPEQKSNAENLLVSINLLLEEYGKELEVSSGYRPPAINANAGGSKKSKHMSCEAIDLRDPDKSFKKWCVDNLNLLEKYGLYMEHPDYTPTWCHLQSVAPGSKKRIFKPY